jgi:TonB family protein
MRVKKVKVDQKYLTIEGTRALYFFSNTGNAATFPEDRKHPAEKLLVTILFEQPLSSIDDASAVLSRIFAFTPEDILNTAPTYWPSQLAKQLGLKVAMSDAAKLAMNQFPGKVGAPDDPSVFHLGVPGVKPPRITYWPEPSFSEAARSRLFQGVVGLNIVVDPTGKVRNVDIVHPLGMGLDDAAVETVGAWRFHPGTKDGQPVAVAIYVDVEFRSWDAP